MRGRVGQGCLLYPSSLCLSYGTISRMREIYGNLWGTSADALCITTNGYVKNNGQAVMGAGCAKEAKTFFPDLPLYLGQKIKRGGGSKVAFIAPEQLAKMITPDYLKRDELETTGFAIVFFPVKKHWRDQADIDLIEKSARELVELTDSKEWQNVVLPRPGCGNGRLQWNYVKQRIEPILDDRFAIITNEAQPAEETTDGQD